MRGVFQLVIQKERIHSKVIKFRSYVQREVFGVVGFLWGLWGVFVLFVLIKFWLDWGFSVGF